MLAAVGRFAKSIIFMSRQVTFLPPARAKFSRERYYFCFSSPYFRFIVLFFQIFFLWQETGLASGILPVSATYRELRE